MNIIVAFSCIMLALMLWSVVLSIQRMRVRGRFERSKPPLAYSILQVATLLALCLLVAEIIPVAGLASRYIANTLAPELYWTQIGTYLATFSGVAFTAFLALYWLSAMAVATITKGQWPLQSAVDNNITVSLLFAGILLGLTWIARGALPGILETMLVFPKVPIIY
jgi:hypothetical protein